MAQYAIWAGVEGACRMSFVFTDEYENKTDALRDAYQEAVDLYEGYAGYKGIRTWADCKEELQEELGYEPEHEEVDEYYNDIINNTIEYYVEKLEEGEEPKDV